VTKLPERSHQQPIAALEHDRRGRDGDRRQRIALRLKMRREGRWGLPMRFLQGTTCSMPPPASPEIGAPGAQRRGYASKDDAANLSGKAARLVRWLRKIEKPKSAAVPTVV
jgi:hypothetical protein